MNVAVIGGTGGMGGAIAKRLSGKHTVIIGSRDVGRAREAARLIPGATGSDYQGAANRCDVAVVAIPYSALDEVKPLAGALSGKLVISIINPIKREAGVLTYPLEKGSAAEMLAAALPKSRVATAFNNVPVRMMEAERHEPVDVLVAASSREAYDEAAALLSGVPGFRALYAGPLSEARRVEQLTVLELNVARWNGMDKPSPRFVSEVEHPGTA